VAFSILVVLDLSEKATLLSKVTIEYFILLV